MSVSRSPTPFDELNQVLRYWLDGVKASLGDNLVGAYLQGSFALGDFTAKSDADFIVVTERDLSSQEFSDLSRLHKEIHTLPFLTWRNALEGSYVPQAIVKRLTFTPRNPPGEPRDANWRDPGLAGQSARAYPFWYLDHGSDVLVRSEHDNNQVVRWILRDHGVVLYGPEPKSLIDPVSAEALRDEVRETLSLCLEADLQPMSMRAWQAFWVVLFCRILHTLQTGTVTSKRSAAAWARETLDPEWADLITRAEAVHEMEDEKAMEDADPEEVKATRLFADYVETWVKSWAERAQ